MCRWLLAPPEPVEFACGRGASTHLPTGTEWWHGRVWRNGVCHCLAISIVRLPHVEAAVSSGVFVLPLRLPSTGLYEWLADTYRRTTLSGTSAPSPIGGAV